MLYLEPYIKISFFFENREEKEELLYHTDFFFEAFEETETELYGFVPKSKFQVSKLKKILKFIPYFHPFKIEEIAPQNWNALWESNFEPILIADTIGVRASFHPIKNALPIEIIIDPKMSFGTGHHATTSMMCEFMLTLDFKSKTVFDFGAGTGILSILASKLNAQKIIALDHEEWAYLNMIENFEKNNVKNAIPIWGDENDFPAQKFNIIAANINRNIIITNLTRLSQMLLNNGSLLLSGFLQSDQEAILSAASKWNLIFKESKLLGEWVCMHFTKFDQT